MLILDYLGADKKHFQKASWRAYVNPSPSGPDEWQYVGKISSEMELDFGIENIEHFDNEKGVQVLYVLTATKIDPKLNFSFMQVLEASTLGFAINADMDDTTDPDYTTLHLGSDPEDYQYSPWKFTSKGLGGLTAELMVHKGVLAINGSWTSGSPGALAGLPAQIRMTQDTTIADAKRDLCYIKIQKPV